jgi:hypothetical protein
MVSMTSTAVRISSLTHITYMLSKQEAIFVSFDRAEQIFKSNAHSFELNNVHKLEIVP